MGTLSFNQLAADLQLAGEVSLPLLEDLPNRFTLNPLRRSNRVNVKLRDEDIAVLEEMALNAGMPFQAFLADIIHKHASKTSG